MVIFYGLYDIIFITRLIKICYIRSQWANTSINPTVVEAKIEFYSYFVMGSVEFILQIVGFIYIRHIGFVDLYTSFVD